MDSVSAKHILVATEEEAKKLQEELKAGAKFDDLAATHSKCPSGKEGGHLGTFGKGQMVPEFEEAAFALKVNEVSGPVKTDFGFHLIERVED